MAEEGLELDTQIVRRKVVIDGAPYEMRAKEEIQFSDMIRLDEIMDGCIAYKDGRLTDEAAQALSKKLEAVIPLILLAPPEILAKLRETHRMKVFNAFLVAPSQPAKRELEEQPAGEPSATSQSSAASTAAA